MPGPSILRPLTNKDEKQNEKEYAPATFTQENITDLVFQNQQLKAQVISILLAKLSYLNLNPLDVCLITSIHNFKWLKITDICLLKYVLNQIVHNYVSIY